VRAQLQSWSGRSEALPVYFPELSRYLPEYPNAAPAEVESLFYVLLGESEVASFLLWLRELNKALIRGAKPA